MTLLSRAFFHLGRLTYFSSTVLHSCGISCLTLAEVRLGIQAYWQDFNKHPADVDSGLTEWERWFADRGVRPGSAVLVAGCGSGREIFPLLERGCRVTGIDPAANALDLARRLLAERQLDAELIEGFVGDADPPGRYDAILFANTTYSLIPERARRVRMLRRLSTQLNSGGTICIEHQRLMSPRGFVITAGRIAGAIARSRLASRAGRPRGMGPSRRQAVLQLRARVRRRRSRG